MWASNPHSYPIIFHPRLPYLAAEVVWAARYELARTDEYESLAKGYLLT